MTIVTALEQHNENTTRYETATFLDKDDSQAAPTSARYRVDNVTESTAVVAWTAIVSPAAVEEIVITAAQNAIINATNIMEVIEVTVEGTYAAGDLVTARRQYALVNLTYFP